MLPEERHLWGGGECLEPLAERGALAIEGAREPSEDAEVPVPAIEGELPAENRVQPALLVIGEPPGACELLEQVGDPWEKDYLAL